VAEEERGADEGGVGEHDVGGFGGMLEVATFGVEGDVEVFDTDLGEALLALRDPDEFATFLAATMLAINEPVAGIWSAVTGAAHGDADLREHLLNRLARIRGQVEKVLRWVAGRGWLRADVPFDDLVEACCVLTSVETYVHFVRLDGRSPERYQEFLARTLRDTVLAR
jgi:hypothetical protein